ncbi:MAG TPA: hypothetical protein P5186_09715 [Candidatus Paceibacterota bacterium]|nr:hypothetical protein [Verrucomicrobiota bacterium]HRY48312.1 hypothetical protein [Candidatus Paceibacterota bacterium]
MMKTRWNNLLRAGIVFGWLASWFPEGALADGPVLKASDVVFMYAADRAVYQRYGATVLAWGPKPTPQRLAEAPGVLWFGSVGMVTEFSAYHRCYPDRYEEGLCRDIEGRPVKVPWLTDHQHEGVPYWWCCTQQPLFRQFLRDRVIETVRAGAAGVHVDDHLGTAGGLWLGVCFCDRCVEGFQDYVKKLPAEERSRFGLSSAEDYDFRAAMKNWLAEGGTGRKVTGHPLWAHWSIYQCRAAASFMLELRQLAAETAGRPLPIGANAGLLWPRHLSDYRALDLFTAETDHHAAERRPSDLPLFAYRLAEAMGRPYAATASGGDWAFIKEKNLPGLVRCWIALSYAAGQRLMAPHHQWCHTPEKGTHWYDGPTEKFAPLYQFVRRNADWLDGYQTYADLVMVLPHRSYVENPQRWFDRANRLATNHVSYRLLVAGDEIVEHPLTERELQSCRCLLVPERREFLPEDRDLLERWSGKTRRFSTLDEALAGVVPAVRVSNNQPIRVLPRTKPDSAVVHCLNYGYLPDRDDVSPLSKVLVRIDREALGVGRAQRGLWIAPDTEPLEVSLRDGQAEIPKLGLWGMLVIRAE